MTLDGDQSDAEAGPSTPTTAKRQITGLTTPPRILIVDHDDSYTHNLLISLLDGLCGDTADATERSRCAKQLLSRTLILPHTAAIWQDPKAARRRLLPHFDAVILSPGPGRPDVGADFGASLAFLRESIDVEYTSGSSFAFPTLGVCLGHQGMAIACGARIKRAKHLRHGLGSELHLATSSSQETRWASILNGLTATTEGRAGAVMTTYNSLVVDAHSLPPCLKVTATAHDGPIHGAAPEQPAEEVVMALQHVQLPMWGVQFHPESIASQGGAQLMRNFMSKSLAYWREMAEGSDRMAASVALKRLQSWQQSAPLPGWIQDMGRGLLARGAEGEDVIEKVGRKRFRVVQRSLGKHNVSRTTGTFQQLFEDEQHPDQACVWLDSARQGVPYSRYSYMARPSWTIEYDIDTCTVSLRAKGKCREISLAKLASGGHKHNVSVVDVTHGLPTPKASRTNSPEMRPIVNDEVIDDDLDTRRGFWKWFDDVQQALQRQTDTTAAYSVDFITGFVGYSGYEMKNECLPATMRERAGPHSGEDTRQAFPSAWYGFCDQVVAVDHETGEWFALGLVADEGSDQIPDLSLDCVESALQDVNQLIACTPEDYTRWTQRLLDTLSSDGIEHSTTKEVHMPPLRPVDTTASYQAKVERARSLIADGQSYEICLTTEFRGQLSSEDVDAASLFALYCGLRKRNPAPYSAYIRLDSQRCILSTSPEKFLGIRRCTDGKLDDDLVEMKPIKGTLARAGHAKGEERYLKGVRDGDQSCVQWCIEKDEERRRRLRGDAKEQAENLMIVDLIRRDLLSFCMPDSIVVPTLMGIETYETVHQMVTTVQGRKRRNGGVGTVEALARCFPPGSMTGAPKVRSVALLEQLERNGNGTVEERRRGVYSGALGWIGLDGAANFSVVIRTVCVNGKDVSVGAGGAITYHSNAAGEWQEVLDKVGAIAEVC